MISNTIVIYSLCAVQAGYTVPMSSLLLGDPTKSYFKLSLWREAAAWAERISAGDIVLFKSKNDLQSWNGILFIQSHYICRCQIKELAKRNRWYHNYVLLCPQSPSAKEAAARQRYSFFVKINLFCV